MTTRNVSDAAACLLVAAFLLAGLWAPAQAAAQDFTPGGDDDPRVGLAAGWMDAEEASWNMELLVNVPRPTGFYNPDDPGDSRFVNSDMAYQGDLVFVGNYNGINIYDVSDPADPQLRTSIVCPGGQGDVSVYGDLLFMSAQELRGRIDCGDQGTEGEVDPERFRGVRVFDISDLDNPRQVAAVQTCRGSHTHTLVTDPDDLETLYVYNSGTSPSRPSEELARCVDERDPEHPETAYWSIDVIEVPLAAPEEARIIDSPRVFADPETGRIDGLFPGVDAEEDPREPRATDRCHDITSYPEIGLAAGACSGNGILLDITNPADPQRVDEVTDENFVFWHSATFNNDGTTVLFTDEWGGGTQPRCRAEDRPEWGANAIFRMVNGQMRHASYFKLPAPQTDTENCVAHNGSLVPVPGRDIKVQAWYQGGISVLDFTDPANPYEIAFFDRGPVDADELVLAGFWSAYWYNGYIYGSEIARGLDVLELTPNDHLSEHELEAARLVQFHEFNPQHQPRIVWPADLVIARAYFDQLARDEGMRGAMLQEVAGELDHIDRLAPGAEKRSAVQELATELWAEARRIDRGQEAGDAERIREMAGALLELAAEQP